MPTIYSSKLHQEARRHLAIREGVHDNVVKLLHRADGLDLLLADEQVHHDVQREDLGNGLVIEHKILAFLHYPVAGYPAARTDPFQAWDSYDLF